MADLKVTLSLLTGKFDQGLATATKSIQKFQSNVNKAGRQIVNSLNFTGINTTALLNPYTAAAAAIGGAVLGAGIGYLKNRKEAKENRFYNQRLEYAQRQAIRREKKDWKTNMTQREGYSY